MGHIAYQKMPTLFIWFPDNKSIVAILLLYELDQSTIFRLLNITL